VASRDFNAGSGSGAWMADSSRMVVEGVLRRRGGGGMIRLGVVRGSPDPGAVGGALGLRGAESGAPGV